MRTSAAVLTLTVANYVAALVLSPCAGASADGEFVTTEARDIRCVLHVGVVACQGSFRNTPIEGPRVYDIVSMTGPGGSLKWSEGNISSTNQNAPEFDIVLTYGKTFHVDGWTIVSSPSGTRFTNDGYGITVSLDDVTAF